MKNMKWVKGEGGVENLGKKIKIRKTGVGHGMAVADEVDSLLFLVN